VKGKAFRPGQSSARTRAGVLVLQAHGGVPTAARRSVDIDGMACGVTVASERPLQKNGTGGPRLAKGRFIDGRSTSAARGRKGKGDGAHRSGSQARVTVWWRVDAGKGGVVPCRAGSSLSLFGRRYGEAVPAAATLFSSALLLFGFLSFGFSFSFSLSCPGEVAAAGWRWGKPQAALGFRVVAAGGSLYAWR
jgi:hypothetical protein